MTGARSDLHGGLQSAMAKKAPRSRSVEAPEQIRLAAIRLFSERGYHGTSMRDLATAVQLEPASLYYHFETKQQILFELLRRTMEDMLDGVTRVLVDGASVRQQLAAVVRFHVVFHVQRQEEAFVSHTELRALEPAHRDAIVALRDQYQSVVCRVLSAGVEQGAFNIDDVRLMATAILTLTSGVADWFGSAGRLNGEQVAQQYVALVMRMVQCAPATGG